MASTEAWDVVIVGAGAGGSVAAWTLAGLGVRTLVLDAGPQFDRLRDYRVDQADWELRSFPDKPGSKGRYTSRLDPLDPRWQALRSWSLNYGPQAPGNQRRFGEYQHVRGIGGSTLHFSAENHRLHPDAMRLKSLFGVAADWPFDYATLAPHYDAVERQLGTAGAESDRSRPRSGPFPLPAHAPSYASQKLMAATRALGVEWQANPVAIPSRPYQGRPSCVYCGQCNRGCMLGDKGSADLVFLAPALASGMCTVRPDTRAIRIEAEHGRIVRVVCRGSDNRDFALSPRAVVLACGALETPRLLLNSSASHSPQGLANESGLVGKNFMETVMTALAGLHPEPLGTMRGLPSDIVCWQHNAPDAIPGMVGGCRFVPMTSSADLAGPINHARRMLSGWGAELKATLRQTYGCAFALGAFGESLPHAGAFIDLDPHERDADGLPLARINAGHEATTPARLDFMRRRSLAMLDAFGIAEIKEQITTYDLFSASHVFGTCRMGGDPSTSVVDAFGRSHRWGNLFVADASLFPTSGGGESPSLTIGALARRGTLHLAELLARRDI